MPSSRQSHTPAERERHARFTAIVGAVIAVVVASHLVGGLPVVPIGFLIKLLIAASILRAIFSVLTGADKPKPEVVEAPAEVTAQPRESQERLVLRVANANEGYVTPEALVMAGDGLTLRAARELLDDLAISDSCEVDADDDGHMTYRFRTTVGPARDAASPEQWVARQSGRMTGERSSADQEVDA